MVGYFGFFFIVAYGVGKLTGNKTAALAIWYGCLSYIVFSALLKKPESLLATMAFAVAYYVLKKLYLANHIKKQNNVL